MKTLMKRNLMRVAATAVMAAAFSAAAFAAVPDSLKGLMYIGTLDQ